MSEGSPEHLITREIEAATNLNSVTLLSSNEFTTVRGYRHHVRTYWPKDANVRGVVSFIHGYASHINRPTHIYLSQRLTDLGYVYLTHDFLGHGYSVGLRGYIPGAEILVDSAVALIHAVFATAATRTSQSFICKPYNIAKTLPVFLIGHSMGGAVSVIVAKELQAVGYNLSGCILLAPMLTLKTPPAWMMFLLTNVFTRFFPEAANAAGSKSASVVSDEYQRYCAFDGDPKNIHGLAYSDAIRYGTLATLLQLISMNDKLLPTIDFPFLVFHDTADVVVPYAGSERLYQESRTDPTKKTFVTMGGGHDLLGKHLGTIILHIEEWLLKL